MISPNESELERCSGLKIGTDDRMILEGARALQKKNKKLDVLVKLGEKGALFVGSNGNVIRR